MTSSCTIFMWNLNTGNPLVVTYSMLHNLFHNWIQAQTWFDWHHLRWLSYINYILSTPHKTYVLILSISQWEYIPIIFMIHWNRKKVAMKMNDEGYWQYFHIPFLKLTMLLAKCAVAFTPWGPAIYLVWLQYNKSAQNSDVTKSNLFIKSISLAESLTGILYRAWQSHLHVLCKISKWLDIWEKCYAWMRYQFEVNFAQGSSIATM